MTKTLVALTAALCASSAIAQQPNEISISQVNGVLWTQQSLEHRMVSETVYRGAAAALLTASKRGGWASLEKGQASSGRKAVIMDLDETVLDNSAYNAWLVHRGEKYSEDGWQDWMELREAPILPGALEFIKVAKKADVDVFFVSNRLCRKKGDDPCPALTNTSKLLMAAGVVRAGEKDAFLLKNQTPDWSEDDKSSRRAHVAKTHQIVMLVGDDMGDFLPVDKVAALRADKANVETARAVKQFGKRWFIIPNPMYGSWTKPLPSTATQRVGVVRIPKGWAQASADPGTLKVATWNMAWMANEVLTPAQAQNCKDEAKKFQKFEERPSEECRKGAPFRLLADYERMAKHAKQLDADIIGIQEVQGEAAVRKILDGALASAVDASAQVAPGTYYIKAFGVGGWQRTALAIRKSILDPTFEPVASNFTELGEHLYDKRGGLEVTIKLKGGSMLTILSVHLKSRCADDPLDKLTEHCPQLAKQAPLLANWIRNKEASGQPYIVLGDYNRNFQSKPELQCGANKAECQKHALGPWIDEGDLLTAPVVVATSKLKHPAGCFETRFTGEAIEHILLGGGAEKMLVAGSARTVPYLDPATGVAITDHNKTAALYSDHCVVEVDVRP